MALRGLGLGGNGRFSSSSRIRWLLTHIAHSSGLGSGRKAPGVDLSSLYPPQYVHISQGSALEVLPEKGGAVRSWGRLLPPCLPSPTLEALPTVPTPSLARLGLWV